MHLYDWLEATRPNKPGYSEFQKQGMRDLRTSVFAKARTSFGTLTVQKSRDLVGEGLIRRMAEATKDLPADYKITLKAHGLK